MEGVGIQCLKQEENLVPLNQVNRTQLFRTSQKLSDLNWGSLQHELHRHFHFPYILSVKLFNALKLKPK